MILSRQMLTPNTNVFAVVVPKWWKSFIWNILTSGDKLSQKFACGSGRCSSRRLELRDSEAVLSKKLHRTPFLTQFRHAGSVSSHCARVNIIGGRELSTQPQTFILRLLHPVHPLFDFA